VFFHGFAFFKNERFHHGIRLDAPSDASCWLAISRSARNTLTSTALRSASTAGATMRTSRSLWMPKDHLFKLAVNAVQHRMGEIGLLFDPDGPVGTEVGQVKILPSKVTSNGLSCRTITRNEDSHGQRTNRTLTVPVPEELCR